jgi:hypothetical protein
MKRSKGRVREGMRRVGRRGVSENGGGDEKRRKG